MEELEILLSFHQTKLCSLWTEAEPFPIHAEALLFIARTADHSAWSPNILAYGTVEKTSKA